MALEGEPQKPQELKETTGGEFRVSFRASIRLLQGI